MDKIEVTQAIEWARKVASSKPPRYTDASRNAARYILATRTDATPVAWMPIDSAPHDEPILAAVKVNHKNGQSWWERHIIVIDSETGTISDMDFHHGWEAEDYECWQPLPAAPDATNTHPPTTDVAALVEENKKLRDEWQFLADLLDKNFAENDQPNCVMWDGERHEGPLAEAYHATFNAIRKLACQALAPFTKGHDDEHH